MIVYTPSAATGGYAVKGHIDNLGQGAGAIQFFNANLAVPAPSDN